MMRQWNRRYGWALVVLALFVWVQTGHAAGPYQVGVYYFPGWKGNQSSGGPAPWDRLKTSPEREPLLGWYPEGEVSVAEQHIQWMHDYGIDFAVYDWYWAKENKPMLEHALAAYFQAKNSHLVRFSLLWANHSSTPESLDQFKRMVAYWIKYYFPKKQYYRIDGKPVVFIFSQEQLRERAKAFGMTSAALFKIANEMAKGAGLPGIYFVGSTEATEYWVKDYGPKNGYDAFSAYNYHRGFSGKYLPNKRFSHSFGELDAAYRESWDWILKESPLPYLLPATSGWSKKPWGGSKDPLHDNSVSTPETFREHLLAAKVRLNQYPEKTKRTVVICCWNEFGEGSYIEPTKTWGMRYLEAIKSAFPDN